MTTAAIQLSCENTEPHNQHLGSTGAYMQHVVFVETRPQRSVSAYDPLKIDHAGRPRRQGKVKTLQGETRTPAEYKTTTVREHSICLLRRGTILLRGQRSRVGYLDSGTNTEGFEDVGNALSLGSIHFGASPYVPPKLRTPSCVLSTGRGQRGKCCRGFKHPVPVPLSNVYTSLRATYSHWRSHQTVVEWV